MMRCSVSNTESNPEKIQIENRIYQSDDILIANPCPDDINPIMDKIREFDPIIAKLRMGVCWI